MLQQAVGLLVFRDVGVDEEHLAVHFAREGFGNAGLPGTQRLDFGSSQHDSGFDRVLDEIIVPGATVLRRPPSGLVAGLSHVRSSPSTEEAGEPHRRLHQGSGLG